jgi:hypothetical protein
LLPELGRRGRSDQPQPAEQLHAQGMRQDAQAVGVQPDVLGGVETGHVRGHVRNDATCKGILQSFFACELRRADVWPLDKYVILVL